MIKFSSVIALLCFISGCATTQSTLYQSIGGAEKIELIVDNFIDEISYDEVVFTYFAESDIDRFKAKMSEHLCLVTSGPCQYTGDNMVEVHTGMNITETDFNKTVDLLINAMTKADVSHQNQNRILFHLAKFRGEIIEL